MTFPFDNDLKDSVGLCCMFIVYLIISWSLFIDREFIDIGHPFVEMWQVHDILHFTIGVSIL